MAALLLPAFGDCGVELNLSARVILARLRRSAAIPNRTALDAKADTCLRGRELWLKETPALTPD